MASSSSSAPPKPVLLEEPGSRMAAHQLDGTGLTIAIISTRWFDREVIHSLVEACKEELVSKGVARDHIKCLQVPGAYEMPFAASRMIHAKKHRLDAVICIGCMVKGATMAYEFVSEATTMGLMKLNVKTETPVVCGLLTCYSLDEAKQCAKAMGACVTGSDEASTAAKHCNHGVAWAQEAIELAQLKRATAELIAKKCACVCHCKEAECKCACHCTQCKCHTCTCPPDKCTCSSCFSHLPKSETHRTTESGMMAQFDQAMCGATGSSGIGTSCMECGKATNACKCEDCKCTSCSNKERGEAAHAKQATSACGGCQQPGCADCGHKRASTSGQHGYHGRSSAPLKGEPNSETLP
jgi:6,7-dimethyl-8-ribityllumazine synthase